MLSREEKPSSTDVLICAKGGGGLLRERMKLAAQLWEAGIKVRGFLYRTYRSCIHLMFKTCFVSVNRPIMLGLEHQALLSSMKRLMNEE